MSRINEPASENFIYDLWTTLVGRLSPLYLLDGRELQVHEPGERNRDAGPDFLSALIAIDGELLRGDVEIHAMADDWYQHGHHRDPRYNRVILHVVTDACPADFIARRQDGTAVPSFNLDSFLDPGAELLQRGLQPTEHWPSAAPVECGLARLAPVQIDAKLDAAGHQWLRLKADRWLERRAVVSWDQVFYEALMEGLGYAKNSIAFLNLSQRLPWDTLRTILLPESPQNRFSRCAALLFGAAGLLPQADAVAAGVLPPDANAFWRQSADRYSLVALDSSDWIFFRLRPNNFPTIRLLAASVLLVRYLEQGFIPLLYAQSFDNSHSKAQVRNLVEMVTVHRGKPTWLGISRSRDITINAILPVLLAYAQETSDRKLTMRVSSFLAHFPILSGNEISRKMRGRLGFSDQHRLTACQQQGALYLNSWVCAETGICHRCMESLEIWR